VTFTTEVTDGYIRGRDRGKGQERRCEKKERAKRQLIVDRKKKGGNTWGKKTGRICLREVGPQGRRTQLGKSRIEEGEGGKAREGEHTRPGLYREYKSATQTSRFHALSGVAGLEAESRSYRGSERVWLH